MRIACLIVISAFASSAGASDWIVVSKDKGRSVELDRASVLMSDAGTRVAWGRVVLPDAEAEAAGYKMVKALNRYDCRSQTFITVKRAYLDAGGLTQREEKAAAERPIAIVPGTLDDRFYREVCKPASIDQLRQVAQSAAGKAHDSPSEAPAHAQRADLKMNKEGSPAADGGESADTPKTGEKHPPRAAPGKATAPRSEPAIDDPAPLPPPRPVYRPPVRPRVVRRPPLPSSAPPAAPHETHWSYEGEGGPQNWAKLQPEYAACGSGNRQSPIDIHEGLRVDLEPIAFNYKPTFFRIVDNGHTIQVTVGEGLSLKVMGRTYELQQFHFHRPAEERIDGRRFDMVIHLVHKDLDGHLAVLAIPLEQGEAHPLIQTLWNNLPLEKNEAYAPETAINPADLLPERQGYYTYMGSLTTPPCTEGVLWMVMKQPQTISADQIAVFARFYRNNARPVQPAGGRIIKESR